VAWFLAAACVLPFQALNGLEAGLAVLLTAALTVDQLRALTAGASGARGWTGTYGVLWLLAGMSRPELVLYGFLGVIPITAAVAGMIRERDRDRRRLLAALALPPLAMCFTYVFFDPIMGFVYRFPTPYLIPVLMAEAVALAPGEAGGGGTRSGRGWRRVGTAAVLGQLLANAVPAWHWASTNSTAAAGAHVAVGHALGSLPEPGRLAVFNAVGALGFFSDWETVEGVGLVTPAVALDHAEPNDLVRDFAPDVIVVTGCPYHSEGRRNYDGYSFVAAVPWLVFQGREPGMVL